MAGERKRNSLSEIAGQVSDEWMRAGRMSAPPDPDEMTYEEEMEFFDEVQRRFDAQPRGARPDALDEIQRG